VLFRSATNPIVKGFMVGRTLWVDASLKWLRGDIGDEAFIDEVAGNFAVLVDAWRGRHGGAERAAA
jgi:5-dehydro-2-deoxygluconokinase